MDTDTHIAQINAEDIYLTISKLAIIQIGLKLLIMYTEY